MWLRCGNKIYSLDPYRKLSKSPWFLSSYPFSDTPHKKPKHAPLQERRMIDRCRLWAKGGDGGSGCSSLRRGRTDRRGKPDGGNGGRGGDVILECSSTIWDLSSLQHHINAKRGGHGTSKNKIGSRGEDKIVRVPVGTVIHLLEGELPSTVEKKPSSAALDPWDMPGTTDFSQDENGQKSISNHPNLEERVETESQDNKFFKDGKTLHKSASEKEATDTTLLKPFCYSSRYFRKPTVEEIGYDHLRETDNDTYESEGEEENNENDNMQYNIAELTEPGQRIVIAQGGDGGLGNVSTNRNSKKTGLELENDVSDDDVLGDEASSPSVGLPGSEVVFVLELKSIADVGLVGMPNAGKSTLLGAMSKAKPTVGHYAFTTLRPNLGNLNYDDFSVTVADIPGLIRGAHENRGLGHAFLRHIERTKVLAYVLDLSAGLDGRKGLPPWEQLRDLVLELEFYREGLSNRPCLIVANKIDEEGADEVFKELKRRVPSVPILPVCAVLEEGVSEVREGLKKLVNGTEAYRLNLEGSVIDE